MTFFDDAVGDDGLDEELGGFIVGRDVAVDGLTYLSDGAEDADLRRSDRLGEEGSDRVDPGASGGREVQLEAGLNKSADDNLDSVKRFCLATRKTTKIQSEISELSESGH